MPCPLDLSLPVSQLKGIHTTNTGALFFCLFGAFLNQNAKPTPLNDSQWHNSDPQIVAKRFSPSLPPIFSAHKVDTHPLLLLQEGVCWTQLCWCPSRRHCWTPRSRWLCTILPWPPASSSIQAPWIIAAGLLKQQLTTGPVSKAWLGIWLWEGGRDQVKELVSHT